MLYYLLIGAWILSIVSYSLACSLWDAMVVQSNDRSLCPSISRNMRHIERNVKDFHDGMVLSYLSCRQVWIRASEPLTSTKPTPIVLFTFWSVSTYNKWNHIHSHVVWYMRWLSKAMIVYFVYPFQGKWGSYMARKDGTQRFSVMEWSGLCFFVNKCGFGHACYYL